MRSPEPVEPPELAVGAIARILRDIAYKHPSSWLLAFLDLLDKAGQAEPAPELIYAAHAALASAPDADRTVARAATREFETRIRQQLKGGAAIRFGDRGEREVLLVVPKAIERLAASAVFDALDVSSAMFDSHLRYRRFPLGSGKESRTVVTMVCMQEAGNVLAANTVRDYISAFGRPDLAVLCGMAMGLQTKVKLGDVVIASRVLDCGPRRVTVEGDRSRFDDFDTPSHVVRDVEEHCDASKEVVDAMYRVSIERAERAGLSVPAAARPDRRLPSLRTGLILAGDELVEDDSANTRAKLHDRLYALEMEGAGFAATCKHVGIDWLVVRGVADRGKPGRDKKWQVPATVAAASFIKTFLIGTWTPDSRHAVGPL